jgi:hypothetical protein
VPPKERALHVPRDEASLRKLQLGPDLERIVQLFRGGRFARAAGIHSLYTSEGHVVSRYGWFDAKGVFREQVLDRQLQYRRAPGLLNDHFQPRPGDSFVVAYEPDSNDHVIFYGDGAPPPISAPRKQEEPKTAPVRPRRERQLPADQNSVPALLEAAASDLDDLETLSVVADRLNELGDPRGELMALQLARPNEVAPLPPEMQQHRTLIPQGVDLASARFSRGFLVDATCVDKVEPRHDAWATVEVLRFSSAHQPQATGSAFDATPPMHRLRELRHISSLALMGVFEKVPRSLEVLELVIVVAHGFSPSVDETDPEPDHLVPLLYRLHELTALRSLEVWSMWVGLGVSVELLVIMLQHPSLRHLWVPAGNLDGRQVQSLLGRAPKLTVHLAFTPRERWSEGRVWVDVTGHELTLHQSGRPNRADLASAREHLAHCGLADPPVYAS